jgi:hypothetical protein
MEAVQHDLHRQIVAMLDPAGPALDAAFSSADQLPDVAPAGEPVQQAEQAFARELQAIVQAQDRQEAAKKSLDMVPLEYCPALGGTSGEFLECARGLQAHIHKLVAAQGGHILPKERQSVLESVHACAALVSRAAFNSQKRSGLQCLWLMQTACPRGFMRRPSCSQCLPAPGWRHQTVCLPASGYAP